MSIELKPSGFREWHDYQKGQPGLCIESNRLDDCMDRYHEGGFLGMLGNPRFGFEQDNMDFLSRATNVRWLHFWDVALKRLDAIYECQQLESISIHPKRPGIDYSQFPKLQMVINHWNKADTGIAQAKFTMYNLWRYQPKSKSFEGLEMPAKLQRLEILWTNTASLAGLPVMKQLKWMEIHRSRNMVDLSELPRIAPKLERLIVTSSKKSDPSAGVVDHPTLKLAIFDGKQVVNTERH